MLSTVGNNGVQYAQNIGISYNTTTTNQHENNPGNSNEKNQKFHPKVERDRDEGEVICN